MERLTTNKKVSEMGMYELAHNSCYVKDGKARYRDFEKDLDARELTRALIKKYIGEDVPENDDVFDEYIMECLMYDIYSTEGLLAIFYRNLWAMAEMREELAGYEDLEESGRLVKLPCAVGDTIWVIGVMGIDKAEPYKVTCITYRRDKQENNGVYVYASGRGQISFFANEEWGRTVFLTREAAEMKLKEMEE